MRGLAIGLFIGILFGALVMRRVEVRSFPPLTLEQKRFSEATRREAFVREIFGIHTPGIKEFPHGKKPRY